MPYTAIYIGYYTAIVSKYTSISLTVRGFVTFLSYDNSFNHQTNHIILSNSMHSYSTTISITCISISLLSPFLFSLHSFLFTFLFQKVKPLQVWTLGPLLPLHLSYSFLLMFMMVRWRILQLPLLHSIIPCFSTTTNALFQPILKWRGEWSQINSTLCKIWSKNNLRFSFQLRKSAKQTSCFPIIWIQFIEYGNCFVAIEFFSKLMQFFVCFIHQSVKIISFLIRPWSLSRLIVSSSEDAIILILAVFLNGCLTNPRLPL